MPFWIDRIWASLEAAGYRTYLVGGGPRDLLLGREPADYDLGTAAPPETVLAIFPDARPTGLKYGTVTVTAPEGAVEVTTLRREGRYLDHRHPAEVVFTTEIEADLARRDFTVNALAVDRAGEWIDTFGGRRDLADRLLRAVGEPTDRFREDPLRLFRGVRLAGELALKWEEATRAAFETARESLSELAPERVRDEVWRILGQTSPEAAADLVVSGLLRPFLPGATRPEVWPRTPEARLARLFPAGWPDLEAELRRLRLPTAAVQSVSLLNRARAVGVGRREGRCFLSVAGSVGRALLLESGDPALEGLRAEAATGGAWDRTELRVSAVAIRELVGFGPQVAQVLQALLEEVWDDPGRNEPGYLLGRAGELAAVLSSLPPE